MSKKKYFQKFKEYGIVFVVAFITYDIARRIFEWSKKTINKKAM